MAHTQSKSNVSPKKVGSHPKPVHKPGSGLKSNKVYKNVKLLVKTGSPVTTPAEAKLKRELKKARNEIAARDRASLLVAAVPQVTEPVPLPIDVPTKSEFARATTGLSAADRTAVRRMVELLAGELGSEEAARLWFVTPSVEFRTIPLDEVRAGNAQLLLAYVEDQQGPSPAYG